MGGGPKTEQGKAITKMNATAHGLRTLVPVIPGEDAAVWEDHRAAVVDALIPTGAMEEALAERIALLLWRLGRVARYETAIIAGNVADTERDYEQGEEERQRFKTSHAYTPNTPDDCRAMIRDATATVRLLRRLATRDGNERVHGEDASDLLREARKSAANIADDDDQEFDPDEVDYPGLPDDFDLDDLPDITIGTLRACFVALATAAKTDTARLVSRVVYHYECEARMAKIRLEEVGREIARLGAKRLMLPTDLLDKVTRYEAHLHRQMVQTLHELEAMQERRKGRAAPLARLDVSGLDATG